MMAAEATPPKRACRGMCFTLNVDDDAQPEIYKLIRSEVLASRPAQIVVIEDDDDGDEDARAASAGTTIVDLTGEDEDPPTTGQVGQRAMGPEVAMDAVDIAKFLIGTFSKNANWESRAGATWAVYQVERAATTGRLHVQGVLRWGSNRKIESVARELTGWTTFAKQDGTTMTWCKHAHVSATKDEAAAVRYCTKVETRVGDTYWYNELLYQEIAKKRNDPKPDGVAAKRRAAEATVREVNVDCVAAIRRGETPADVVDGYIRDPAVDATKVFTAVRRLHDWSRVQGHMVQRSGERGSRDRLVYVLCGPTSVGKSHFAKVTLAKWNVAHALPLKQGNKWWADGLGGVGKTVIFFDEVDEKAIPDHAQTLLMIADKYDYSLEVKGSKIDMGQNIRVVVFATNATEDAWRDQWNKCAPGVSQAWDRRVTQYINGWPEERESMDEAKERFRRELGFVEEQIEKEMREVAGAREVIEVKDDDDDSGPPPEGRKRRRGSPLPMTGDTENDEDGE